jgi:flagellar basal body L-ring protein FlgH
VKKIIIIALALLASIGTLEAKSYYRLDRTPYSDFRAFKVGDLLTLNIEETANSTNDSSMEDNKEDASSWDLTKAFLPYFQLNKGFDDTMGGGDKPGVGVASAYGFKSDGKRESSHTFTTIMQVQIVEIMAEGVFFIRGSKQVDMNGKVKNLFVSGKVRENDIMSYDEGTKLKNKIEVYNLADAVIQVEDEILTEDGQPGWMSKIMKKVFH